MGSRKRLRAEERKENTKAVFSAQLRNCPTSPRKMRLVIDLIRGESVDKAIEILHFSPKHAAKDAESKAEGAEKDAEKAKKKAGQDEVTDEKSFREYAEGVLKKAHGDDYDEKIGNKVIDGIIGKRRRNETK